MPPQNSENWLKETLPLHNRLKIASISLLKNMLNEKSIEFLDVYGRTKTLDSALEKIERKNYSEPIVQMTDLTGIRVITYLESQVRQVSEAIRTLFEVDEKNSLDRTTILGNDKIGYRSTHFVCTLGKRREMLPEYAAICDLKFEIQVRTVLQHAWAELAHDRSFKFGPGLPGPIERKLNLYSGMLEIVDGGFDAISREIDDYRATLKGKTIEELSDVEISNLSLDRFIDAIGPLLSLEIVRLPIESDLLDELKHFGIEKIGQLESITSNDTISGINRFSKFNTNYGVIRDILMFENLERYLGGPVNWVGVGKDTIDMLSKKYGRDKVEKLFARHGISVVPGSRRQKRQAR